ncbi:autotransporter outer membrane beta-barrel domain-containing protein [Azotosporobacter soli]|uniref:autotransporter outer membrane beta-barrel domain-containing protein n=1 Tax=Azotosporobacter soli TaxID=3055040 RepID=UPI0031FEACD0
MRKKARLNRKKVLLIRMIGCLAGLGLTPAAPSDLLPVAHAAVIEIDNSTMDVYWNYIDGANVNSGGTLNLLGRASLGGITNVNSGGTLNSTHSDIMGTTNVNSGGVLNVNDSGYITGITNVNGGTLNVNALAGVNGITNVNSGTVNVNAYGYLYGTTNVNSGGKLNINAGGYLNNLHWITNVNNGGVLTVNASACVDGTTNVNSGGAIQLKAGAALSGNTQLEQGLIQLSDASAAYSITNLAANNGAVSLFNNRNVGNNLSIGTLQGTTTFIINTDLAHGRSDRIAITNAVNAQNKLKVNYDPSFLTGRSITGSAVFATVASGSATFQALPTDYGAYRYTPTLSQSGTTWSITGFTLPSAGSEGASQTVYSGLHTATSNLMLWRAVNNNLTRRMGELRTSPGNAGEWLRIYRGAQETPGSQLKQTYTAMQGGYDTRHEGKNGVWFTGYALGYLQGSNTLERGSGSSSSLTLGAYASWLGNNGQYLDLIAKQGRLRNNFDSYLNNASATQVNGNYSNWGSSLSAEYGLRKKLASGWYLEPQAEINLGRTSSASYTTSDGTSAYNRAANSVVGRLGLAIGRMVEKSSFYVKASLAREFSASSSVSMTSGGLPGVTLGQNLKDTWLEMDLGWTISHGNGLNSYLELSRTSGGITNMPWQVNAGIRKSF